MSKHLWPERFDSSRICLAFKKPFMVQRQPFVFSPPSSFASDASVWFAPSAIHIKLPGSTNAKPPPIYTSRKTVYRASWMPGPLRQQAAEMKVAVADIYTHEKGKEEIEADKEPNCTHIRKHRAPIAAHSVLFYGNLNKGTRNWQTGQPFFSISEGFSSG